MNLLAVLAALCFSDAPPMPLEDGRFTLDWTHSVEKIHWHEDWQLAPVGLRLTAAAVRGSGAGMEAGNGAVFRDGWWRWQVVPAIGVPQLILAASGATGAGWRLCDADRPDFCREIGTEAGAAIRLYPCGADPEPGLPISGD